MLGMRFNYLKLIKDRRALEGRVEENSFWVVRRKREEMREEKM